MVFDFMFYIDLCLSNDSKYLEIKHHHSPDFNETFIGSIEHYKYEYLRYLSKLIYDYKKYSNYRFLWIKMVYVNLKHVSYFTSDEYKVNIQNERRGKVLRLPFEIESKSEKIIVRVSGPQGDLFVEDYLPYKGESEWLEIDSNEITYFFADHQDQLDTIEIMYE